MSSGQWEGVWEGPAEAPGPRDGTPDRWDTSRTAGTGWGNREETLRGGGRGAEGALKGESARVLRTKEMVVG